MDYVKDALSPGILEFLHQSGAWIIGAAPGIAAFVVFAVSVLSFLKSRHEIAKLKGEISMQGSQAAKLNHEITKLNGDIAMQDSLASKLKSEIEKLQKELEKLDLDIAKAAAERRARESLIVLPTDMERASYGRLAEDAPTDLGAAPPASRLISTPLLVFLSFVVAAGLYALVELAARWIGEVLSKL